VLGDPALHSVIMELNGSGRRYGFDEVDLVRHMADLGFATFSYDAFTRRLVARGAAEKTSDNVLFVRNLELVQERVLGAPRFTIKHVEI